MYSCSVPFPSTKKSVSKTSCGSPKIYPLGGGALPDINDAVGVPYDPSAGLKPWLAYTSLCRPPSAELGCRCSWLVSNDWCGAECSVCRPGRYLARSEPSWCGARSASWRDFSADNGASIVLVLEMLEIFRNPVSSLSPVCAELPLSCRCLPTCSGEPVEIP